MKSQLRNPVVILALITVTFILLGVALFSQLYRKEFHMDLFLGSDGLYLPSIFRDVFENGNPLRSWHFNPAPNFFPDMILYFILNAVTGSFMWATFLFALIEHCLLVYLLVWIFRLLFPSHPTYYYILIAVVLSLFALEGIYFTRDVSFAFYVFMNSYHTGAFMISLFCTGLMLKYYSSKNNWLLVALFVLVIVAVMSDRLFIVLFPAPCIATMVILFRETGIRRLVTIAALFGIAVYSGIELFLRFGNHTYNEFREGLLPDPKAVEASISRFSQHMAMEFGAVGFKGVFLYLFVIVFIASIYTWFRYRKTEHRIAFFFLTFSILFSVIVVLAPLLTGKYGENDCIRYNIYPVMLNGINIAVMCAMGDKKLPRRYMHIAAMIVIMLVAGMAIWRIEPAGINKYFNYYPPIAQLVDEASVNQDLRCGVGNHWISKKATMFSKKGMRIRTVFDDLSIYDHVASDDWYFNNIFNFVVLNNFADTTLYRSKIRDGRAIKYDGELKLIKTRAFTYDRAIGYRVKVIDK